MKKFRARPSKGANTIVNINGGINCWCSLFTTLVEKDAFAPMLIVMGHLNIIMDADCPWVNTPYAQRYAWIGELMADAEREEIKLAADSTGLFTQGLNDLVIFALSSRERKQTYAGVLEEIVASSMAEQLVPEVRTLCESELCSV